MKYLIVLLLMLTAQPSWANPFLSEDQAMSEIKLYLEEGRAIVHFERTEGELYKSLLYYLDNTDLEEYPIVIGRLMIKNTPPSRIVLVKDEVTVPVHNYRGFVLRSVIIDHAEAIDENGYYLGLDGKKHEVLQHY